MFAEVKRFVEADVNFACRAEWRHVSQQFLRDLKRARMQWANLTAFQGRSIWRTEFVQVVQFGHLDQVLRVPEEIDDRNDLDARFGRGVHEAAELFVRVSVAARNAGQARVFDGILEMEVHLVITPLGVARQLRDKPVESLHLTSEVPLKRADHVRS